MIDRAVAPARNKGTVRFKGIDKKDVIRKKLVLPAVHLKGHASLIHHDDLDTLVQMVMTAQTRILHDRIPSRKNMLQKIELNIINVDQLLSFLLVSQYRVLHRSPFVLNSFIKL